MGNVEDHGDVCSELGESSVAGFDLSIKINEIQIVSKLNDRGLFGLHLFWETLLRQSRIVIDVF